MVRRNCICIDVAPGDTEWHSCLQSLNVLSEPRQHMPRSRHGGAPYISVANLRANIQFRVYPCDDKARDQTKFRLCFLCWLKMPYSRIAIAIPQAIEHIIPEDRAGSSGIKTTLHGKTSVCTAHERSRQVANVFEVASGRPKAQLDRRTPWNSYS